MAVDNNLSPSLTSGRRIKMELLNINHIDELSHPVIQPIIKRIREKGLENLCQLNSDAFEDKKLNIVEFETVPATEKEWESHKKFIDVFIPIEGSEIVYHNFMSNLVEGEYDAEKDLIVSEGPHASKITIHPGDILILYPEDAHKPGIQVDVPQKMVKAVVKVPVDSEEI